MSDTRADPTSTASGDGGTTDAVAEVGVVVRPRLVIRWGAVALLAGGLALVGTGRAIGLLGAVAGLALLASWWPRVTVTPESIVVRGLRTTTVTTTPVDDVDAVSLRRIPFGPPRPPRRTYRLGRFSSTPMRLRVLASERIVVQITVVWWDGWGGMARFLLTRPDVVADSRTRGRLERYG